VTPPNLQIAGTVAKQVGLVQKQTNEFLEFLSDCYPIVTVNAPYQD
jgi:hypothetical protein